MSHDMDLNWNSLWLLPDVRTLLLFVFLFVVFCWYIRKPQNLPPGPWGFPVVGSLPAFIWALRRGVQPHQLLTKYAARYGPVFSIKLFNKTFVILSDYASVKEAFQHPQLNDRPTKDDLGVSGASGEPWIELRRFCLTVLRGFGVGKSSFEEKIGIEGKELLKEMAIFNGKPFDPKPLLGRAISNVICSVVFGNRFEYTDQEFTRLLTLLSNIIRGLGTGGVFYFFPILGRLPFLRTSFNRLLSHLVEIHTFIQNAINVHRVSLDAENPRDFVDVYLIEKQRNLVNDTVTLGNNSSSKPTVCDNGIEKHMNATVCDLFMAGSETTATTLEWSMLYMAIYPDVQRKVQAEIDAAVGRNRLPGLADKSKLNFTRAVVWEIQRMASIVPLGLFHAASSDTPFRGFLIPKDTLLVPNMWNIFRDPELWPEPEKFKPERFLDDEGKAFQPDEFIPFGTGRRICIGEHLAKMELFILFSYFIHQFTFEKPENSPPLTLDGKSGLTFSPLPFEICAIKRD